MSDGERKREGKRERTGHTVHTYRRIHFIGGKNPLGNYRQIYVDTRRTTDRGGISRSNVGTRMTLIGRRGKSEEGREKIKRAPMINRGGTEPGSPARSWCCKTMFARCGGTARRADLVVASLLPIVVTLIAHHKSRMHGENGRDHCTS